MPGDFEPITDKDTREWLRYISKFQREKGYPPTVREIQDQFEVSSTSVVNYRLQKLISAGYLDHTPYIARGIKVTPHGLSFIRG